MLPRSIQRRLIESIDFIERNMHLPNRTVNSPATFSHEMFFFLSTGLRCTSRINRVVFLLRYFSIRDVSDALYTDPAAHNRPLSAKTFQIYWEQSERQNEYSAWANMPINK